MPKWLLKLIPGGLPLQAALYGSAAVVALGAVGWFALHERHAQAVHDRAALAAASQASTVATSVGTLAVKTLQDSTDRQANELNIHVVSDQAQGAIRAAPQAASPLDPGVDTAWRAGIERLRDQAAASTQPVGSVRGGPGAAGSPGTPSPPR